MDIADKKTQNCDTLECAEGRAAYKERIYDIVCMYVLSVKLSHSQNQLWTQNKTYVILLLDWRINIVITITFYLIQINEKKW